MRPCSTRSSLRRRSWIRQGVEARRTRNEGRVRALKQLRIERRERRERLGQVDIKAQDAAPSGKLVFEASEVYLELRRRAPHRGFLHAHHARRSHRHHRSQRLWKDHADQTPGRRARAAARIDLPRNLAQGRVLRSAARIARSGGVDHGQRHGGQRRHDRRSTGARATYRDICAIFCFRRSGCSRRSSMLSGGERNRLLLAKLFAKPSNLLVMDEPTNDLDAETLDLLEEMVADYAGTLFLVSHDRAFLDNVVTSTLVFEGGGPHRRIRRRLQRLRIRQQRRRARRLRPARKTGRIAPSSGARCRPPADAASAEGAQALVQGAARARRAAGAPSSGSRRSRRRCKSALSDPALFREEPAERAAPPSACSGLAPELEAAYARWELLESGIASSASGAPGPRRSLGTRYRAPGRIGNYQRRGLLAPQLLQLAHGLLHGLFGGFAEFRDRGAQGSPHRARN